ncbi:glycosyltransferase family 2 protein [Roseobacter weihaiensis]|uniref:glycosyltransferase family 2 protein n=1 Tax=Roseobacter weihaiensis TaxID=2763262 RepID=UPI001D09ED14|nr:glycosyltransferase family 2 protein [Roseobacter sp. H9]
MTQTDDWQAADSPLNCLAVLTVRNEAAFLLEWLAHHHAVGFNRFLVFSNDCQDGTDVMLDRLQDMGWLTHLRNDGPYHDRGIQFTALKAAQRHPLVKEADWILPLDIDEFVTIKTGDHTLPALLAALPEATAITLTWRLFGNAGQIAYQDAPVTEVFTHCAPEVIHWPWRAAMFKTLYKNDGTYRALGVHRPRAPRADRLEAARWFDGQGRALHETFKTRRIFSDYGQPNHGLVQLNHYPLGAMESFVLKADRGRAVHAQDRLGLDYWVERNFNMETDTSIHALSSEMQATRTALLSDRVLNDLHQSAVAWRRSRFNQLMRQDLFRALYGRLLMAAPSRLVPVHAARSMLNFGLSETDSNPAVR